MLRNNLFIKICLWFWLTTLFMIGGVITVDWMTESGPFRAPHSRMHGPPAALHGQALVWIYEHEGAAALNRFAAHLQDLTGIRPQLLDEKGVALAAASGSSGAATQAVPAPTALQPETDVPGPMPPGYAGPFSLTVTGSKGRIYTLVSGTPIPPRLGDGGPNSWGMTMLRLLVVLTVSGIICYLLARYLTSPILKIGAAARQLASGDLSVRVGPAMGKRNDELARLAIDFDRMAEQIALLLNSQRTLLRDISHELRSPLARLNVALELCRKGTDGEASASLDRIERESGRLNEMIGHILTLNRVESDPSLRDKKHVDVAALVREITSDAEFEAGSLNRTVNVEKLVPCIVEGNEEMLRRAIDNVIRNAVRYTPDAGEVEINLSRVPGNGDACDTAVLSVRDHGKGVPEESLPHLFRPFYRVGEGRERQTGGTGLGLAITEAAVRLHSGSVLAANAPGGGLIVEITLPVCPVALRASL